MTLASVMPQARAAGAEVLVVTDGDDAGDRAWPRATAPRLISLPAPAALNAARNAGRRRRRAGDLIVFVDDDIEAPAGLAGGAPARRPPSAPSDDVFGGPIRARLEGGGPRCLRPRGRADHHARRRPRRPRVEFVWGANMAIRRRALERIGGFDEAIQGRGDEEEWERRYTAAGGRVRYVAAAGLDHRRTAADATVRALSRAAYALGRTARRNDVRKGVGPTLPAELRTLAGCVWHTGRRRCANGIVMAAHSARPRARDARGERRS